MQKSLAHRFECVPSRVDGNDRQAEGVIFGQCAVFRRVRHYDLYRDTRNVVAATNQQVGANTAGKNSVNLDHTGGVAR
jgi:hypothetical protein